VPDCRRICRPRVQKKHPAGRQILHYKLQESRVKCPRRELSTYSIIYLLSPNSDNALSREVGDR